MNVDLWVPGHPVWQGSKRAFVVRPKGGQPRAVITDVNDKDLARFRGDTREAWTRLGLTGWDKSRPMQLAFIARFARPQNHYGTKGLLPSAADLYTKTPDVDKLARAVMDALTGLAYDDDRQVFNLSGHKAYVEEDGHEVAASPGVEIMVTAL